MTTFDIQPSTSNNQSRCEARAIGSWKLNVGCWMFLLIALYLAGASVNELHAAEIATTQTNTPQLRAYSESDVLALLTATLQRDYVKDKGDLELRFTQPWTAPNLPDEPLTVKIQELPTAGISPSFILRFQLCTAQQTLGTWQATVQAFVWRDVWVAHSNLRRGDPVSAADIAHERCDVLKVREALAEFSADDPSLELAESASSGAPLLARMIKPRTVIHRGQITNALVQDGGLSITTKVEALEDGAPGQTIHARNPASRRNLSGRVLDGQTILVSL